eukprot:15478061-Alexandrium_andersonii.AAC.1
MAEIASRPRLLASPTANFTLCAATGVGVKAKADGLEVNCGGVGAAVDGVGVVGCNAAAAAAATAAAAVASGASLGLAVMLASVVADAAPI